MALFSGSKKEAGGNGVGVSAAMEPGFKAVPPAATPTSERQQYITQMRVKVHQKLVERLNVNNLRSMPPNVVRQECRNLIRDLCQSEKGLLTSAEQDRLTD